MKPLQALISAHLKLALSFCKPQLCRDLKMKILNWVHGKLNGPTSSVSHHSQKEVEIMYKDRSTSLELSVQDREEGLLGWEDGLLAIGTLGCNAHNHPDDVILNPRFSFRNSSNSVLFDPRDSVSDDQEEYLYQDTASYMEEIRLVRENDEKPLMYDAYNYHQEIEEAEDENVIAAVTLTPFQHDVIGNDSVKSDRTTLADLFKADPNESVIIKDCSPNKGDKQIKKFPTSFSAKLVHKLIPGHEVEPIKKINHMIRKVMKRKIHPELPRHKSTKDIEIQVAEVMALLPSG